MLLPETSFRAPFGAFALSRVQSEAVVAAESVQKQQRMANDVSANRERCVPLCLSLATLLAVLPKRA